MSVREGFEFTGRSVLVVGASRGGIGSAIAAGFLVTEQTVRACADATHDQRVLDRTRAGRWGQLADIVGTALFLASPAAACITGAVLPVDGGYTAV